MKQNLEKAPIRAEQPAKYRMKKLRMMVLIFLLAGLATSSSSAQKNSSEKKGNLEILLGGNVGSPASQMYDLMIQYQFNATTLSLFGGGYLTSPSYGVAIPFTGQIAYTYKIGAKSKAGLILSYSNLKEVDGTSMETGYPAYLFVSFSNISVIPIYRYELLKFLELQAGPALMFNNGKTNNASANQSYSQVGAGLLTGLNLRIWDSHVTYGKISTSYLFATKSKMGPFSTTDYITDQEVSIPESSIGFSQLIIGFVLGVHI